MMNGRLVASERPGHSILEGAHIARGKAFNISYIRPYLRQSPILLELSPFYLHSTSPSLSTAGASTPVYPAYKSSPQATTKEPRPLVRSRKCDTLEACAKHPTLRHCSDEDHR